MSKTVIKRFGFKVDAAEFQAKALKALAGEGHLKITLRGPWRTVQGNVVVDTPCFARLDVGVGFVVNSAAADSASVRPDGGGATVDLVARIEREIDER